ncbi:MAG TPA: hypothetical protein VGE69_03665 [Pseudomonadales bacterium]
MLHGKRHPRHKTGGFTLFEMVVSICSIVILYMIAEQRLNDLPAAAERANFFAVLEQIKTGVNFEMVTRLASGRGGDIRTLEGVNPMNFLIEAPSNYRGELEAVTDAVQHRNSWYFETATGELVFVVGGSSINDVKVLVGGVPVSLGQIRLRLTNVYGQGDGRWQALILAPVREYNWERRQVQPVVAGEGS